MNKEKLKELGIAVGGILGIILFIAFLIYEFANAEYIPYNSNQGIIQEEKQEIVIEDDTKEFEKEFLTLLERLNYYYDVLENIDNTDIIKSYELVFEIEVATNNIDIDNLKNYKCYSKDLYNLIKDYKYSLHKVSYLLYKSYNKNLTMNELSSLQEFINKSALYRESCNTIKELLESEK